MGTFLCYRSLQSSASPKSPEFYTEVTVSLRNVRRSQPKEERDTSPSCRPSCARSHGSDTSTCRRCPAPCPRSPSGRAKETTSVRDPFTVSTFPLSAGNAGTQMTAGTKQASVKRLRYTDFMGMLRSRLNRAAEVYNKNYKFGKQAITFGVR